MDIPQDMSSSDFSAKVVPSLEQKMMDPNAHFIFSSRLVLTYMISRKFRQCIFYMEKDERIPPLATKMGYSIREMPKSQIRIALEHDSTEKLIYTI